MADRHIALNSPAKVNWSLRVLGRRPDGFHELESLVSTITLSDELILTQQPSVIELECDHPGAPCDATNLVVRAARLLSERAGCTKGVHCRLVKRIPAGGGLGGGSSNAATALKGLLRLWELDWDVESVLPLAAELGSDVPFFLRGGAAVMRGRGERLEPVHLPWSGWVVLLLPGFPVSTAAVYAAWRSPEHPPQQPVVPAGRPADAVEWMDWTFNMLEEPAMIVRPVLREIRDHAARLAGRAVRMSGSGSTLFTAFDEESGAENFARLVRDALDIETRVVRTGDAA